MRSVVCAVDPGGMTGFATYTAGEEVLESRFSSCEVPEGRIGFRTFFDNFLSDYTVQHVVCEDFVITPQTLKKSRQMDALRIIGWLELTCDKIGIPFTLQRPVDGKAFATDAKLKAVGAYAAGTAGHCNDASRHLVTFLVKQGEADVLDRLVEVFG
jgi:hypothetical protein